MSKTEKKIMAVCILLFVALWVSVYFTVHEAVKHVQQQGIKGVVTELWEGRGVKK